VTLHTCGLRREVIIIIIIIIIISIFDKRHKVVTSKALSEVQRWSITLITVETGSEGFAESEFPNK